MLHIIVAVADLPCSRQLNPVNDAGMIQSIGKNQGIAVGQRGKDADVGSIAAIEDQSRLLFLELS